MGNDENNNSTGLVPPPLVRQQAQRMHYVNHDNKENEYVYQNNHPALAEWYQLIASLPRVDPNIEVPDLECKETLEW